MLFAEGQTTPATITGRNPQTDLAVLHVQTSRQLKVISLGSSSSVKVGPQLCSGEVHPGATWLNGSGTCGIDCGTTSYVVHAPGQTAANRSNTAQHVRVWCTGLPEP